MNEKYKEPRLAYLDNLKVLLTSLVILGHASVTYGPVGFWYYTERPAQLYILAFITSLLQTFMIGLFFLIAAYFVIPSYNHKGPLPYIYGRIKKLGIPVIAYVLLISPCLAYLGQLKHGQGNFFSFYFQQVIQGSYLTPGPLWFILVLLIFTLTLIVAKTAIERYLPLKIKPHNLKFPSSLAIFLFITGLGLLSFVTRIWFPIGSVVGNLQLSFLVLYCSMFVLGILAYRYRWLDKLNFSQSLLWSILALAALPLWPAIVIKGTAINLNPNPVFGGFSWQSLSYSLWEALVGLGISISLLYLFKQKLNKSNAFSLILSRSAYATIVVHPIILVLLSVSMQNIVINPGYKFLIVALAGIPLCFAAGALIIRIPTAKHLF